MYGGPCASGYGHVEHQIDEIADHHRRRASQWRELVPTLDISPALLIKLDRIGLTSNLFASLLAVFVIVDPPNAGPWWTLEKSARVLLSFTR